MISISNRNGKIVNGNIVGDILCNSKLSGMPDLLLSIGNKNSIDPGLTSLHPCVRVSRYERDGVISFVPPDGPFRLMEYMITLRNEHHLPLDIRPAVNFTKGNEKIEILVKTSRLARDKAIEYLSVSVALPKEVSNVMMTSDIGSSSYDQKRKVR